MTNILRFARAIIQRDVGDEGVLVGVNMRPARGRLKKPGVAWVLDVHYSGSEAGPLWLTHGTTTCSLTIGLNAKTAGAVVAEFEAELARHFAAVDNTVAADGAA